MAFMRLTSNALAVALLFAAACDGNDECPAGETLCADSCVDLSANESHCGACGIDCGGGTCTAGACSADCDATEVSCGTVCCPVSAGCDSTGAACAMVMDTGPMDVFVPPPPCPDAPPADGEACERVEQRCTYVLCPESVTRAECERSGWLITALPCDDYECDLSSPGTATCTGDQLCVARMGGAFIQECADNPCGTGPIEDECACAICGATDECSVEGTNITCTVDCGDMPCP